MQAVSLKALTYASRSCTCDHFRSYVFVQRRQPREGLERYVFHTLTQSKST